MSWTRIRSGVYRYKDGTEIHRSSRLGVWETHFPSGGLMSENRTTLSKRKQIVEQFAKEVAHRKAATQR